MRGDILAVCNYSFLGNRIRKSIRCEYNHLGLFVDDEYIIEATFLGVKKSHISKFQKMQDKGKAHYAIYTIKDISEKQINTMLRFASRQIGKKYDFLQLITLLVFIIFRISRRLEPLDNTHQWICSELIAESAYDAKIIFSEKVDPDNINPADVLHSKIVEKRQ